MDIIEVSGRCVACGEDPEGPERCQPKPALVEKLEWYREQPGLELRENMGNGHVVAVGRPTPRPPEHSNSAEEDAPASD